MNTTVAVGIVKEVVKKVNPNAAKTVHTKKSWLANRFVPLWFFSESRNSDSFFPLLQNKPLAQIKNSCWL